MLATDSRFRNPVLRAHAAIENKNLQELADTLNRLKTIDPDEAMNVIEKSLWKIASEDFKKNSPAQRMLKILVRTLTQIAPCMAYDPLHKQNTLQVLQAAISLCQVKSMVKHTGSLGLTRLKIERMKPEKAIKRAKKAGVLDSEGRPQRGKAFLPVAPKG